MVFIFVYYEFSWQNVDIIISEGSGSETWLLGGALALNAQRIRGGKGMEGKGGWERRGRREEGKGGNRKEK